VAQEFRRHPRLETRARADVIGREVLLHQPLLDLSLGGAGFPGPGWEEVGSEVELVLSFPDGVPPLCVTAQVMRSDAQDLGVRFVGLSDEQKWTLRRLLRSPAPPRA
jgi:hypothetical protein